MTNPAKSPPPKKSPPRTGRRFARMPGSNAPPPVALPKAAARAERPKTAGRTTKVDILVALLSRAEGATIGQMMEATGWQSHSVRGFLAGTLKKKPGITLSSVRTDVGRTYHVVINEEEAR